MKHNLDEIFDKFYPRSQTVEQGVFLLRAAWTVEIILAIIGCLLGLIMMFKFQQNPDETTSSVFGLFSADGLMMGLIFFMVGIIELTKIPLSSAVYYSKTFYIRMTFLIALILVNISTFETVVAGFERINNLRTEKFLKLLIKKDTLEDQILEKRIKVDEKNLNKQISDLRIANESIINQIQKLENSSTQRKNSIQGASIQSGTIETLEKNIQRDTDEIAKLQNDKLESQKLLKDTSYWKKGSIEDSIRFNQDRINQLTQQIAENTEKLAKAKNLVQKDNRSQLSQIDKQSDRSIKPLQESLVKNEKLIERYTDDLNNIAVRNRENLEDIRKFQEDVNSLVKTIDEEGPKNQVIRVASWFKDFFIIDYEKENNRIAKEINKLETSKVFNTFILWQFRAERTPKEIEIIDNQISMLEDQTILNEKKLEIAKSKGATKSVYSDIPQAALTFAFWAWFGVLSFIVSVTGTMLAFASLNLRDPRMHEERNLNKRKGLYWRFARLLAARRKYIWERTKILFKPKIVEKEVEVEKIVEKIVEKPVIQEKIIEKEIEVPKQIEKKVFVHVPFPTDDPEVIKKGPMIYNDKDIDKGKK